jgi:hypothetical protein
VVARAKKCFFAGIFSEKKMVLCVRAYGTRIITKLQISDRKSEGEREKK